MISLEEKNFFQILAEDKLSEKKTDWQINITYLAFVA